MNNKLNTQYIKLILLISILITLTLGGTYAFLNVRANNNSTTGTAGCFSVNYNANVIDSSNLSATTNYLEGANTTVTLSKSSDCQIYSSADIYLYTNTTTTAPIATVNALKYKVFQGSTLKAEGTITQTGATKLATVDLTTTSTDYKVYLWVDSDLSEGKYDNKTYSGYIYAESTQQSTIK